jgi:cellulose synthase/poly-beta-1,6-N-acetylglucosamine synthase-like glycosyltransferase
MNTYIVGQLLELITLAVLGICFVLIIAASFHDVWMTRRAKAIQLQTRHLKRNRPHVTIIIYAKNSALFVSDCLLSILKNRYRQYDIIVINNHSSDQTKVVLAQFKRGHEAARLTIYNKRKDSDEHTSLRQAYRKSKQGEIVLVIRPEATLSKTFIKDAVAHFQAFGSSKYDTTLLFNERLASSQGLIATLRYFQQSSRQFLRKSTAVLPTKRQVSTKSSFTVSQNAIYTRTALMDTRRTLRMRYAYDSRLSVVTNAQFQSSLIPKRTPKQLVLFYVIGIGFASFAVYSTIVAATFENTTLLLLGWCVVVVWFFAGIWSDDSLRVTEKLRYSFVLPSLYFFLTVLIVIEVAVRGTRQLIAALQMTVRVIILYYNSQPAPLLE